MTSRIQKKRFERVKILKTINRLILQIERMLGEENE